MGGSECFSEGEERLVLSEVHFGNVGSSTKGRGDSEDGVVISRYQYLVPPPTSIELDGAVKSPCTKESDESDSEGSDSGGRSRIVRRRRKRPRAALLHQSSQRSWRPAYEVLTVVHRMATPVSLVGQQVWSAAFLLGDFVLTHEDLFAGATVLELGAGPGVAGLIAARVAVQTFVTDYHDEVLKLLARNVEANMHLISNGNLAAEVDITQGFCGSRTPSTRSVEVRKLDWTTFPTVKGQADEAIYAEDDSQRQDVAATEERGRVTGGTTTDLFAWKSGELELLLSTRATGDRLVILASDIIYDEDLTEAFFSVLEVLMSPPPAEAESSEDVGLKPSKSIPLSVPESVQDELNAGHLDSTSDTHLITPESKGGISPAMERQSGTNTERHGSNDGPLLYMALEKRFNFTLQELSVAATGYRAFKNNVFDVSDDEARESSARGRRYKFEGKRLLLTFHQCFRYQRGDAMEIWEIRRRTVDSSSA